MTAYAANDAATDASEAVFHMRRATLMVDESRMSVEYACFALGYL